MEEIWEENNIQGMQHHVQTDNMNNQTDKHKDDMGIKLTSVMSGKKNPSTPCFNQNLRTEYTSSKLVPRSAGK